VAVAGAPARNARTYAKAIVVALLCFGALLGLLEIGMRLTFNRYSRIGGRIAREYDAARSLQAAKPGDPPTVLFVGNSLLLEGVNFTDLQQRAPEARVSRLVIESTSWLDWYYGIRRLIAQGTRPNAIVLCLDSLEFLNSSIRGEYSSYYLFQLRDIPGVAQEAHYNLTQTSGLVLSHFSRFYAERNNLRNFLLNRVDEPYVDLIFRMTVRAGSPKENAELERLSQVRLAQLKAAGDAAGLKCILLIPPGFTPGGKAISEVASRVGIEVWVPIADNVLPRSDYSDGYHLNAHGNAIFTEALAGYVKKFTTR
jgi:hypothetical protein